MWSSRLRKIFQLIWPPKPLAPGCESLFLRFICKTAAAYGMHIGSSQYGCAPKMSLLRWLQYLWCTMLCAGASPFGQHLANRCVVSPGAGCFCAWHADLPRLWWELPMSDQRSGRCDRAFVAPERIDRLDGWQSLGEIGRLSDIPAAARLDRRRRRRPTPAHPCKRVGILPTSSRPFRDRPRPRC